ncbi:HPt (histidine-containing phosphotransfer) domain-containing protein [Duganella sp. CF517]|uniref:Hpt domain-containing protein n=1 Tax=Duganella sp. CF517 TaxID=1881038 RepID=UPI0008B1042A|nr:Hpt domain-containing protein [Duganella sp. CF517]SEN81098.1 HPt (histidine-containing phosphotransfer) domain-containing protein [Duganella sp. CF517]
MSETSTSAPEENVFSVVTLLKYMGNDDKALAIVSKIVRDACAPGLAPFDQARAAIEEQRLVDAGKIFHSLRGSVGTLGAKRLVASSLKLEQALAERQTQHIPALFADLQAEYQLVLRHAEDWLLRNVPRDGPTTPA